MESRSAFRQVADESSRGRVGTVTLICPKCRKEVRSYECQVNGFNEWAFKQHRIYDAGLGRTTLWYHRVDYDGRGCCF